MSFPEERANWLKWQFRLAYKMAQKKKPQYDVILLEVTYSWVSLAGGDWQVTCLLSFLSSDMRIKHSLNELLYTRWPTQLGTWETLVTLPLLAVFPLSHTDLCDYSRGEYHPRKEILEYTEVSKSWTRGSFNIFPKHRCHKIVLLSTHILPYRDFFLLTKHSKMETCQ